MKSEPKYPALEGPALRGPNSPDRLRRAGWLLFLGIGFLVLSWLVLHPPAGSPALAAAPNDLPAQIEDTETPTATSTETPTVTVTETPTPTSTETPTLTATATETGTPTPTVTGTPPTSTPTATETATLTPTVTGTPPTPTVTGTITPNVNSSLSVTPGEARAGGRFTFRITITNSGLAPAFNTLVTDTFSSFLDISGATSTKGTVATNPAARTVNVTIGTINPNETVTILIIMTVNNSATATTTQAHNSVMIFTYSGITQSKASNAVAYRIVVGSTLPPTGGMEQAAPETSNSLYLPAIGIGFILFSLGLLALIAGGRMRSKGSAWSGWLTRTGLLVLAAGVLFALGGLALSGAFSRNPPAAPGPSGLATPTGEIINFSLTPEAPIVPWPDELETLPDYPIPTPTVVLTPDAQGELPDASPATRLIIPAISVDNIVKYVPYDGQSWMIAGLRQEIAWMGDTSWPGLGGNTGLAGHVTLRDGSDGPFRNLSQVQVGDEVIVYTEEKVYTYKISWISVVDEDALDVIQPQSASQVTLVTCAEWSDELKMYLKRLVVTADLQESRPIHAALK
jgi:LPXTG-site transpeptidase (sortase) family protein